MDDDQQFCLRWNNHQSTLVSVFDTLLEKGIHVDCTLAAEGQTLRAHKVVLCACSPYFENVLSQQFDKHPIIILKDVKYAELRAMMDYMYRGEVNISQDQLAALLKAAESLQIKGLSDNKPARPLQPPAAPVAAPLPAAPVPAALPLPLSTPAPHAPHTPQAQHQHPPAPQIVESSIDSREGSLSPSRRRKKPRRPSDPAVAPANATAAPNHSASATAAPNCAASPEPEPALKEETSRHSTVEDLTIDEDMDDHHSVTHNDVVRNFQWHLERSQDELMNSSDGVRDSQGDKFAPRPVTRSRKVTEEEKAELEKVTTLAVLRTVKAPLKSAIEQLKEKENKKQSPPKAPVIPSPPKIPAKIPAPKTSPMSKREQQLFRDKKESRFPAHLFPPPGRRTLPCAQYKTEKGYRCPNCQRCYNARKNLVRHVTLECGRDPQYKCPYCSYSKHRRNELKKHMQRKHPERLPPPSPPSPRDHDDSSGLDDTRSPDRMSI